MKMGRMLRSIEQPGTQLKLRKGQKILAHLAVNQPDHESRSLYFVRPAKHPHASGFAAYDCILVEQGFDFLLKRERY